MHTGVKRVDNQEADGGRAAGRAGPVLLQVWRQSHGCRWLSSKCRAAAARKRNMDSPEGGASSRTMASESMMHGATCAKDALQAPKWEAAGANIRQQCLRFLNKADGF